MTTFNWPKNLQQGSKEKLLNSDCLGVFLEGWLPVFFFFHRYALSEKPSRVCLSCRFPKLRVGNPVGSKPSTMYSIACMTIILMKTIPIVSRYSDCVKIDHRHVIRHNIKTFFSSHCHRITIQCSNCVKS